MNGRREVSIYERWMGSKFERVEVCFRNVCRRQTKSIEYDVIKRAIFCQTFSHNLGDAIRLSDLYHRGSRCGGASLILHAYHCIQKKMQMILFGDLEMTMMLFQYALNRGFPSRKDEREDGWSLSL